MLRGYLRMRQARNNISPGYVTVCALHALRICNRGHETARLMKYHPASNDRHHPAIPN